MEGTPEKLGKYRIIELLGRGAMGVVYRAEDPEIGRTVAVKLLHPVVSTAVLDAATALERFKTEAHAAGNLRHPNIVTIFDASSEGKSPYIVMDYIEGRGLDGVIAEQGKLDPYDAMYFLSQIAAGLDHAHRKGVIHRDIKPANILIDRAEHAYILDFGVASVSRDAHATPKGPVMGSPGYMSPEQLLNETLDARADIFSLAIVAFECLAGQRPFSGADFTTVAGNILNGKRHSLSEFSPELPLSLDAEFEKAFSRARDARFKTATLMIQVFCDALGIRNPSAGSSTMRGYRYVRGGDKASDVYRDLTKQIIPAPVKDGEKRATGGSSTAAGRFGDGTHAIQRRGPSSYVPQLIAGIGALVVGGVIFLSTVMDSRREEGGDAPAPRQTAVSFVGSPPPRLDRAVEEMSSHELLSELRGDKVSESRIVTLLREGAARKLVGLLDVSERLLQSDSYLVRTETIAALAQVGDKAAVPSIMVKLDDHDPAVRIAAAKALGDFGDRRALGYLTSRLTTDESDQVRLSAKEAIEKINGYPLTKLPTSGE